MIQHRRPRLQERPVLRMKTVDRGVVLGCIRCRNESRNALKSRKRNNLPAWKFKRVHSADMRMLLPPRVEQPPKRLIIELRDSSHLEIGVSVRVAEGERQLRRGAFHLDQLPPRLFKLSLDVVRLFGHFKGVCGRDDLDPSRPCLDAETGIGGQNQDAAPRTLITEAEQGREQPIVAGLGVEPVLREQSIRRFRIERHRINARSEADRRRRQSQGGDFLQDRLRARLLAARPGPFVAIELGEDNRREHERHARDAELRVPVHLIEELVMQQYVRVVETKACTSIPLSPSAQSFRRI